MWLPHKIMLNQESKNTVWIFTMIMNVWWCVVFQVHPSCQEDRLHCGAWLHHGHLPGRPCSGLWRSTLHQHQGKNVSCWFTHITWMWREIWLVVGVWQIVVFFSYYCFIWNMCHKKHIVNKNHFIFGAFRQKKNSSDSVGSVKILANFLLHS